MNFVGLLLLLEAFAFRTSSQYETKNDEPVDALKAVAALPKLVLLSATIDVPMFVCLTADLTALNESARTATITWHVRGQDGQKQHDVLLDSVMDKDAPDSAVAFMNSDTANPMPAQVIYSDYKSCMIIKMSFWSQESDCRHLASEVDASNMHDQLSKVFPDSVF